MNIPLSRKRALENIEGIAVLAEVIEEKAFLSYAEKNDIAYIKGVPDDYDQIMAPDSILIYGSWLTDNDPQVVIGRGIASDFSVSVNDYSTFMQIMVPKPGTNVINAMNLSRSFSTLDAIATGEFSVKKTLTISTFSCA